MREIIFRGKRMDNGEWVEGSFLRDGESHRFAEREDLPFSDCYIVPKSEHENVRTYLASGVLLNVTAYHVIPTTVGQDTGLKDKNGKRIFEGGILLYQDPESWQHWAGSVICYKGGFVFLFKPGRFMFHKFFPLCFDSFDTQLFEVIGNIHDNPELLKEAE